MMAGRAALLLLVIVDGAAPVAAQSWRLRFDGSAQRVSFRGITPDSVPESAIITGPHGGPVTAEGFAVTCFGDGFCRYYRPGSIRRGIPASAAADLTMWGLGVTGLRVRVHARTLTDFSGDRLWPGTAPSVRLVEGYAEYVRDGLTARVGRMLELGRLGGAGAGGLDGARASWRFAKAGLEAGGYAGWGLARGTVLPVTSPAVNPLAEFQPGHRQVVAGLFGGAHWSVLDAELEYRREVDPRTDYFVSERASASLSARPHPAWRLSGGAEYDLAEGRWGSADAMVTFSGGGVWATVGGRRYRPFFDLWTVWGVFSPVPHHGINGSVAVNPLPRLRLRARGEWFRYDDTETSTPTVTVEDRGWRWGVEGSATPGARWIVDAGVHGEFLPGAASRGVDGRVTWLAREWLDLSVRGGSLERPLELRFQDAGVTWAGLSADYRSGERWRVGLSVDRYWESRDRPDAAAFDWNQWRASARVSLTLRSAADRWVLPPGRPRPAVP